MEQRHFCQASLNYVFLLQEVQECKKYEFVETVSIIIIYRVYMNGEYKYILRPLFTCSEF